MKQDHFNTANYCDTTARQLTIADLSGYFDEPLIIAAAHLGVSDTFLKRQCRLLSIQRWPYRRIQALLAQKQDMERKKGIVSGMLQERWCQKIEELSIRIDHLREYGSDKDLCISQKPSVTYLIRPDSIETETISRNTSEKTVDEAPVANYDFGEFGALQLPTYSCFPLKLDMNSLTNDLSITF